MPKNINKEGNFKIITDMKRDNEIPPENAGCRLIKVIRGLGIKNKIEIFSGNNANTEFSVKTFFKEKIENLFFCDKSIEIEKFVID